MLFQNQLCCFCLSRTYSGKDTNRCSRSKDHLLITTSNFHDYFFNTPVIDQYDSQNLSNLSSETSLISSIPDLNIITDMPTPIDK